MDIGPGDFVECVSYRGCMTGTNIPGYSAPLTVGSLYRVEAIVPGSYSDGTLTGREMILLVGFQKRTPWGARAGYSRKCFRPIYRPKADLIQSLLTNIPEGVEA